MLERGRPEMEVLEEGAERRCWKLKLSEIGNGSKDRILNDL